MKSGVYGIRNLINDHVYIGSTVNFTQRRIRHASMLGKGAHHSAKLQNAWKKYGANNFAFEILEPIEDCKKLLEAEQIWINELQACSKSGYNIAPRAGNSLGRKATKKTRQKQADSRRGYIVSEATKRAISVANTGKRRTDAERKKMARSAKKRGAHGTEVYAAIAAANTGKKRTDEQRARISASRIGKPLSKAHRAALKQAWVLRKARSSKL